MQIEFNAKQKNIERMQRQATYAEHLTRLVDILSKAELPRSKWKRKHLEASI